MTSETNAEKARRLRVEEKSVRDICIDMCVARSTVYGWLGDSDRAKAAARKASYQGTCERCGGPTTGCNGPTRAPKVCRKCLTWTATAVLDRAAVCMSGVQEVRVVNHGSNSVVPLALVVCRDDEVFRVEG